MRRVERAINTTLNKSVFGVAVAVITAVAPVQAGTPVFGVRDPAPNLMSIVTQASTEAVPVQSALVRNEQTPRGGMTHADYVPGRNTATLLSVDLWYSGVNWSRPWEWAWNWGNIALNKISAVPVQWKRTVLRNGLEAAFNGATAAAITRYYRSQGLYCPDKPWWLPLGSFEPAWPILTCAESAR